jgi:DNA excision repair protein ERCC-2
MNQYITESASNLSTDMALVLSKHFLRMISQPQKEGVQKQSLWSLADVEKAQAKAREQARAEAEAEEISKLALEGETTVHMMEDEIDLEDDDDYYAKIPADVLNRMELDALGR